MPQLAKGGKFVFGWSLLRDDYTVRIPDMAVDEYEIAAEGKVILSSGSKTTGGFMVSRKALLNKSKIGCILEDNPQLSNYTVEEGEIVEYKGRLFSWVHISEEGCLKLNDEILQAFSIKKGDKLLAIRGSNLGIGMGVKGPLIALANNYQGKIETY